MENISNHNGENQKRLVIISNRLPIVIEEKDGEMIAKPGSGGLVTALAPVLQNRGGIWIGCPGIDASKQEQVKPVIEKIQKQSGFHLFPVYLTKEENDLYYGGFSNEVIWPLFHDLQSLCHFDPEFWHGYQKVNEKFAETIANNTISSDYIWVHDYHLLLLGEELHKRNVKSSIGFFQHIPFPPLDIFIKLPWRFQVLRAMLKYHLIGFQTMRDLRNFIHCVRKLLPDVKISKSKKLHTCTYGDHTVNIGAFPISIDFKEFAEKAASSEVSEAVQNIFKETTVNKIIFGVDRLDYSKGIIYRLESFRHLLKQHPEYHKQITFVQIVVPSRIDIPEYSALKEKIDRKVGEINSEFTKGTWVPIHYVFRSVSRAELLAYYRAADVAFVTPVKDGMNLVAKEFVACNIEENGVLILSEFAGAAAQLHDGALLVNPYDIEGNMQTLHKALTLTPEERKLRMRKMRKQVRRYNIYWWLQSFLNAAFGKELVDFPILEEIIPES